jgi:hypothetical protein
MHTATMLNAESDKKVMLTFCTGTLFSVALELQKERSAQPFQGVHLTV